MDELDQIETVRLAIEREFLFVDGKVELKPSPSPAEDYRHVEIIRRGIELFKTARQIAANAESFFSQDIEMRKKTVGRAQDISMPYEISGATYKLANLSSNVEQDIFELLDNVERLEDFATFSEECPYSSLAGRVLTLCRKVPDRLPLFVHSYLWLSWIYESVDQTHRMLNKFEDDYFKNVDEDSFGYLSHPSIVVALMACTASIEEVGAKYINYFTDIRKPPDNTNAADIVSTLDDIGFENIDFATIQNHICKSRTNLVHYITRRENVTTYSEAEDFIYAAVECMNLISIMSTELLDDLLSKLRDCLSTN